MADSNQQPPRQPSKRPETARYVVAVDHQIKSSFGTDVEAENEADRIRKLFPKLTITVVDSAANSVDTLGATHANDDEDDGA